MSKMSERFQDQEEQENLSGISSCEEWNYHHAEVCVYCGKHREDKLQCCSEVHFDTQFNIDKNEKWHEKQRRLINDIHQIVETQIKPRIESQIDFKPF